MLYKSAATSVGFSPVCECQMVTLCSAQYVSGLHQTRLQLARNVEVKEMQYKVLAAFNTHS
jgi:hypothetical protein